MTGQYYRIMSNWKGRAFLESGTRKEAYLKALGTGLNHPLAELDTSTALKESPHRMSNKRHTPISIWSAMSFEPRRDYAATLVVEGNGWYPHFLQFVRTQLGNPSIHDCEDAYSRNSTRG